MIERGDWQVSDVARDAFDLEGKIVGTIGAGRIGYRVLQRLAPFNCKELLYYDYAPLPEGKLSPELWKVKMLMLFLAAAKAVNVRRVDTLKDLVAQVCNYFMSNPYSSSPSVTLLPLTALSMKARAASLMPNFSLTSRREPGLSTRLVALFVTRKMSLRL